MTRLPTLILIVATLVPALAHAQRRGRRALADRDPRVLLRATRMGYHRDASLRAQRCDALAAFHRTLLHSDLSGVALVDSTLHAHATWRSREACIAGQKDPVAARRNVASSERRVAKADAVLASLPRDATGGFRFGSLFKNKWLLESAKPALFAKLEGIYRRALKVFDGRIDANAARVGEIERRLHKHLDSTAIKQEPQVRAQLGKMTGKQLFDHALALVQQIDAMAHNKTIRRTTVETGQSSSETVAHTSSRYKRVENDDRGRVSARERGKSTSTQRSTSRSSYKRDALLLHAASYTVNVRNGYGRQTSKTALTPIEARMVLGILLELNATARALDKRDPKRAAAVHHWVEHSTLAFNVPTARTGRDGKEFTSRDGVVQIGHVQRDAIGLRSLGIVSKAFARHLDKQLREPIENVLTAGSALLRQ